MCTAHAQIYRKTFNTDNEIHGYWLKTTIHQNMILGDATNDQ